MSPNPPPSAAIKPSPPAPAINVAAFATGAACIANLLAWHQQHHGDLLLELEPELTQLLQLQAKLEQNLVQIVAFGLVSRGKSAVLNAIYGEPIFPTGALNGVTQWPRSIRWVWPAPTSPHLQLELTDTPGLDEIAGAERGQMAQTVAANADLILFISAGPLAPTETDALKALTLANKPLLWVLNKQDLYPDLLPEHLYQKYVDNSLAERLSPSQLIPTAAAPTPRQVRLEWPDGRSSYQWEPSPNQVDGLQARLAEFFQTEASLVATTHALLTAQGLEQKIIEQVCQCRQPQAQKQVWQYAGAKSLVIAGLGASIGSGSLMGWGLCAAPLLDLLLIRAIQRCYGLPINAWVATKLVSSLFLSSGILGLIYLLVASLNWMSGWGEMGGGHLFLAALLPALGAAYGSYQLAQALQRLLKSGAEFQPQSPQACLQTLWQQIQPGMLLASLLPHLKTKLAAEPILRD